MLGASKSTDQGLGQKQILEQYSEIVRRLTLHRPLIILLDDLHWADGASVDLLFHLTRRMEGSRLLIIGTYRPQEVAVGRADGPHPLEQTLAEIKRYYGHEAIQLEERESDVQRQFIHALIDSQPNRLGPDFRDALLRHTEGHPLFTVELLRSFQEQGRLVRDREGRWTLAGPVDWDRLPSRVEGVIESRIGRLDEDLRQILRVACVQGATFMAEVVARVLEVRERDVVHRLSHDLEKHHRIVTAQGANRIDGQRVSVYGFRHILFQRYLYGALDPVERTYLHEDVGKALEALHGSSPHSIAVELAHHFREADDRERAARYQELAGDAATSVYAYGEALLHYRRSLETLAALADAEPNRRTRVDVTIKLARVAYLGASPADVLERLKVAEPLAGQLGSDSSPGAGDPLRLARVHYWMGRYLFLVNAPREAIGYYRKVLEVAADLGDEELLALPSSVIGRALVSQGYFERAVPLLRQALAPLENTGNVLEWIHSLNFLGSSLAATGRYAEALERVEVASRKAAEIRSSTAMSLSLIHTCGSHMHAGEREKMLATARSLVDAAEAPGAGVALYVGLGFLAWALGELGRFEEADAAMARCREVARELGDRLVIADWFAVVDADIALGLGRPDDAAVLAEKAVELARGMDGVFAEARAQRVWACALEKAAAPWPEVEEHLRASVRAAEAGGAKPELARTHALWGALCRDRGDAAGALPHFDHVARSIAEGVTVSDLRDMGAQMRAQTRRGNVS
jgi:tetratricopeptide (TPR) repeat protein